MCAVRRARAPRRSRRRLEILTLGRDFATVNLVYKVRGQDQIGRQSQTWVRFPEGWKVVSAHVSRSIGRAPLTFHESPRTTHQSTLLREERMAQLVGVFQAAHTPFCYRRPEDWNQVRGARALRADVPVDDLESNRRKYARVEDGSRCCGGNWRKRGPM